MPLARAPVAHGQATSTASAQVPSLAAAQDATRAAMPVAWSDGVKALGEKIVAAVKPSRTVSLEVKNISSLSAADVETIRRALEAEVRAEGLRMGAGGTDVEVTLSENFEGYVWVAEVHRMEAKESVPNVAIVSVAKSRDLWTEKSASLVLSKRQVWEQAAKMLDFAIVAGPSTDTSRLVILGTETFWFYRSNDARWELEQEIQIPHSAPSPRNVTGWIDAEGNRAYLRGIVCSGDFLQPKSVRCEPSDQNERRPQLRVKIQGREDVDTAVIGQTCRQDWATLATATTDWTQPDFLQGYVSQGSRVKESGAPLEMDGPVLALYPTDATSSARVIVRNLKTGSYEGYIVTATCSQ